MRTIGTSLNEYISTVINKHRELIIFKSRGCLVFCCTVSREEGRGLNTLARISKFF